LKTQELEATVDQLTETIRSLEARLTETEEDLSCLRCFLEDIGIVDGQLLPWQV